MVVLADIPLVMPLAEWIWGGGGDVDVADGDDDKSKLEFSPKICLSQVPFLSMACFKQLISKGLGVAIIAGSCLNKVPIMINMMQSQSAAGISRNSLYGEAVVYANGAMYGYLYQYPFTSYGENASLLIQNIILIVMAWQLSNNNKASSTTGTTTTTSTGVSVQEQITVIVGFSVYCIGIMQLLPSEYWYLLMSGTWPVMMYARGSQVYETFRVKHTGNLSIVTTTMNLVGSLIRIGTTLQETGDTIVLAGYLLSGGLSFLMFVQYWLYLNNTREVLSKEKQQKDTAAKKKET
jgi:mannose-P-dolichol utilization defect 1